MWVSMCTLPCSFKSGMGSLLKSGRGTSGIASTASPSHTPQQGMGMLPGHERGQTLTPLNEAGTDLQKGNDPDRRGEKETKEDERHLN